MAEIALADVQALCHRAYADVRLVIVLADVVHGFQHISALVPLADADSGIVLCRFRCNAGLQLRNGVFQVAVMKGLEQIVHRPQPQGALRIAEIVIGRQDNHIGLAALGAQSPEHLNAIHLRHFQVGDNQIGVQPPGGLQALRTIGRLTHHHAVQRRPIHCKHNALANHLLVLYHQHPQHIVSSSYYFSA